MQNQQFISEEERAAYAKIEARIRAIWRKGTSSTSVHFPSMCRCFRSTTTTAIS